VGARIDQLRVDPHAITGALNTSFHHIRHSEFVAGRSVELPMSTTGQTSLELGLISRSG
jgi:hypothetical protein